MKKITIKQLNKLKACLHQVNLFKERFGNELIIKSKNHAEQLALDNPDFDFEWASRNLLTASAFAEYKKVADPAWAEYEKIERPAWAEYKKIKDPAWAEYQKIVDLAFAEYQKIERPAFAKYEKIVDPAFAEYQKIAGPAFMAAYFNQ